MSAGSVGELEAAIRTRKSVEAAMGSRWNDLVRRAVDRDVLKRVEEAEKIYRTRLVELQRVHNNAHNRLSAIMSSPLR